MIDFISPHTEFPKKIVVHESKLKILGGRLNV